MLALALLALALPLAQAAEPTCRLVPPASKGCFSLHDLKGREIHVPANTTRLEPDALRLCPEPDPIQTLDLGVVVPASTRRTLGMDSAMGGVTTFVDTLAARGGNDHVALTISRLGVLTTFPTLVPVARFPDPLPAWQAAKSLSTTTENYLVQPIGIARALLDGTRTRSASSGTGKVLVIFVHGPSTDWDPWVRQGLEATATSDPTFTTHSLVPLQVETHVVLVEDVQTTSAFPTLESRVRPVGVQAHHLVSPSTKEVEALLRKIVDNRRGLRPSSAGTIGLELRHLDLAVSSWTDPYHPIASEIRPSLDSAMPLREGTNTLELRRTRRVGALTLRDTTRLTIVADLPPGTDSLVTSSADAGWMCRASVLRIERMPTRDRPLMDVLLRTRAVGLTVQEFRVTDSALGGQATSFLEGGAPDLRWVGNLEAPLDQPGAPVSVSSRGDLIVAHWRHPRDPRDSARDSARINPDRTGWVRFSESALPWPGGRVEATAWLPQGKSDSLRALVQCGTGAKREVVLVRDGETWGASFSVKAGTRPWGDSALACGDAGPGDSVQVHVRMEGLAGDSLRILDRPVASGAALCAVKMRPGACFDPALLEDHGWIVPKNTTHLDLGSMSLCMPSRKVPAPARIAWVMDNSGSMQQNDPLNIRFETIWRGILRQVALNPASEAGFVRFSSSIEGFVGVKTLTTIQQSLLRTATQRVAFTTGTNWELALRSALITFDSSTGTGPAAIVMISDGLPNEGVWENAIRPGMPPVYVLYIGNPAEVSARPDMQSLIRRTGGRLWILGTSPAQSLMDAAVAEIMGQFETEQTPLRATIASSPSRQNARITSFQQTIGGAYVGQADSLLALVEGGNSFELQLTTQSAGFPSSVRNYPFSLSVERAASPASFDLAGSPFRISCGEPGSLRFVDSTRTGVDWMPTRAASFGLEVSPRLMTPAAKAATANSTRGAGQIAVALPTRLEGGLGGGRFQGTGPLTAGFPVPGLIIDTLGDSVHATWCHERVPRDCASGTLALVRLAAAPAIRFLDDTLQGPRGTVRVEVQADALSPQTLDVELSGASGETLTMRVARESDGLHRGEMSFSQVSGEGSSDTLSLERPVAGLATRLRAVVTTAPDADTAYVTVVRRRDTLVVEPGPDPGTVRVRLVAPDLSAGGRLVVLTGTAGTDSVTLGDDGTAVRPLRTLVGESLDSSRILAVSIDTLYRDTLRAALMVEPLPATRVRFVEPLPSGTRGRLWLEARVPSSRAIVRAVLSWPQGDVEVYLVRDSDGLYRTSVAFGRGPSSSSDTLILPASRSLELTVTIPPSLTWRTSSDALVLNSPVASWDVVLRDSGRIDVVSDRVDGRTAVVVSRTESLDRTHATVASGTRDSASVRTWTFLGESLDSARVEILRIDPVFGDTARRVVTVPSPWTPSSLSATPDTLDPRGGDSTLLEVRDRDLHADRRDTVEVRSEGGDRWLLVETGPSSGVFQARVASRALAPDWASRAYLSPWTVALRHEDPDHPGDTSRVSVVLVKIPPPPETTSVRLRLRDPDAAAGQLVIEVDSPLGRDTAWVVLQAEGAVPDTVRLVRDPADRTLRLERAYTRWPGPASDTLRWPSLRNLVVRATLLPDPTRLEARDSAVLGSRRTVLTLEPTDSSFWKALVGPAEGPVSKLRLRQGDSLWVLPLVRTSAGDSTRFDPRTFLRESRDSVDLLVEHVDPVYGDTTRRTVRVASPWVQGVLSAVPDTVDVSSGTEIVVTLRDRDPNPGRIDTARVVDQDGKVLLLVETSPSSGRFQLRVRSWALDPQWVSRAPGSVRTVRLTRVDPDHPDDTARTEISLVRGTTGLQVGTLRPLVPVAEIGSSDRALRLVDLPSDADAQQGVVIQTWIPVVAEVFVYDLQGTWVTSGSFRIEPDPASGRGSFLVSWNGTDHRGVPVGQGPYPTRIMVRTHDNALLLNQVLVLGRREAGVRRP